MSRRTLLHALVFAVIASTPVGAVGQVSSFTELRIPRQHSAEFIELYAEMATAMEQSETGVRPTSQNLLQHAWATNVSFVEIVTYETLEDLFADFNGENAKIRAYAQTLDEADREAFRERYGRYLGMYLEGHSDENRSWIQDWGFGYETAGHEDHAHVVARSRYSPTWANRAEFLELMGKLNVPADPSTAVELMIQASGHTTGSGANVDVWRVYESWSDFAEAQSAPVPEGNEEDWARLFEIEGRHRDDIFTRVGTLVRDGEGPGRFHVAGN